MLVNVHTQIVKTTILHDMGCHVKSYICTLSTYTGSLYRKQAFVVVMYLGFKCFS